MTTIGMLGGGQLGWMLGLAGRRLGFDFICFDPVEHTQMSAYAPHIRAPFDDLAALETFARKVDLVTYEFENVPVETARFLSHFVPVFPPPLALEKGQDRIVEKDFFRDLGMQTPPYLPVSSREDLDAAIAAIGLPAVLKTRRFGYDGKGQFVLKSRDDASEAWASLGGAPLILEGFVRFTREVSILAARGRDGTIVTWPLVENHHYKGILRKTISPAPHLTSVMQDRANTYIRAALEALDYVGVLAIELFEVHDPATKEISLLANEMAPRVHNSGHFSIEGSATSQFENHIRAVAGLPLGPTTPNGLSVMLNIVGQQPDPEALAAIPYRHLHDYGKSPRPRRKLAHVTFQGASDTEILLAAAAAEELITKDA